MGPGWLGTPAGGFPVFWELVYQAFQSQSPWGGSSAGGLTGVAVAPVWPVQPAAAVAVVIAAKRHPRMTPLSLGAAWAHHPGNSPGPVPVSWADRLQR